MLFVPTHEGYSNWDEREISIDSVRLIDTYNIKGSRMKLEIIADDQKFYLWYPQSCYLKYANAVQSELLSGKITSVTAIISPNQTGWDKLFNQNRIVDLRCEKSVYYDFEAERIRLLETHFSKGVLCASVFILSLSLGVYIALVYKVVSFRKS